MPAMNPNTHLIKNTTYKVVLPFYAYAALSFLVACLLLVASSGAFTQHYFHPRILAITHIMALGWGTMIILGASYQLVPVLIEGKLYSNFLAYLSFGSAAAGIPLLSYSFYNFNMGCMAQCGAVLINIAVVLYGVNLAISIIKSKHKNVQAAFVLTAALWLCLTTVIGLLLVFNFTMNLLPKDSLHYLSLHAHIGFTGWFLLLVTGVGSRLIPMFLISKYSNTKLLWSVFVFINAGLVSFIFIFFYTTYPLLYLLPVTAILAALLLFGYYCYQSFSKRIRRQVDGQMKTTLLSVGMMWLPVILLMGIIVLLLLSVAHTTLVLAYGFAVFFGWLTAIILGMTFKTLPFIVWNKIYHDKAGSAKTPNPKELFSPKIYTAMGIAYLAGFLVFVAGILLSAIFLLQTASVLLLLAALLYNWNILKMLLHTPVKP